MNLTLRIDDDMRLKCYCDASFAVHDDGKSHTAFGFSFGQGLFYCKSVKQRIVTKSSTESELVGLNEAVTHALWCLNFIGDIGYEIKPCIVWQDNRSTISIVNGGMESIKRTKHLTVRQLFVKEKVDAKLIEVKYMPTHAMIVDIMTKAVRGPLFRRLRDAMLNVKTCITTQARIGENACQQVMNVVIQGIDTNDLVGESLIESE